MGMEDGGRASQRVMWGDESDMEVWPNKRAATAASRSVSGRRSPNLRWSRVRWSVVTGGCWSRRWQQRDDASGLLRG